LGYAAESKAETEVAMDALPATAQRVDCEKKVYVPPRVECLGNVGTDTARPGKMFASYSEGTSPPPVVLLVGPLLT